MDIGSTQRKYAPLLIALLLISLCLKLYYVDKYATYTDEILSSIVAKAIAESGIPRLPSGSLYPRAPLHHYILAIPIGLFGLNYTSMRISSIIFSLLTILITYLLGVQIASRRIAFIAALLLASSSLFNQVSLSGRMYMTYTFFFTLTLYYFYKGFIKGDSISKILSIFAMSAAMLCSKTGVALGPILGFLLCVSHKNKWLRDGIAVSGFLIWIILAYFVMLYRIPGEFDPFTVHSGVKQYTFISLELPLKENIINLSYPWRALDACLPFAMALLLAATVQIIRKRQFNHHFALLALLPTLIIFTLLTYRVQYRIMVSLLPIYFLACCSLASHLIKSLPVRFKLKAPSMATQNLSLKVSLFSLTIFILFSAGIAYSKHISSIDDLISYYSQAFGYHDARAEENPEPAYLYLRKYAKSKDIIIQTTLEYGYFFLGTSHDYYYLRQKQKVDEYGHNYYTSFGKPTDPYYARPIIDSQDKLKNILLSMDTKIWCVLGPKSLSYLGPQLNEFIKESFQLEFNAFNETRTNLYIYSPKSKNDSL